MDSELNLNELWAKQNVPPPQLDEILSMFNMMKQKSLLKIVAANVLLFVTLGVIITIWIYAAPKYISTNIGLTIITSAVVIYLIAYNRLLPYLQKINENQTNSNFLKGLVQLKEKQRFHHTRVLEFYFISLTIGLTMYMYEYLLKFELPWSALAYAATLAGIAVNWFIVRPKVIRKEQAKMDDIIRSLEMISQQREDSEPSSEQKS